MSWDSRFIELAQLVSTWSKDPSTKVGAVIVDEYQRIVSLGFNGYATGITDDMDDRETKYKMVIHAEENALLFADRQRLIGATLYTTPFMPCARCAAKIIQCGLKRVVSIENDNPRWVEDFKLTRKQFDEAGIILEILK